MITLTWQHLDLHCIQIVEITRWFLQNSKMRVFFTYLVIHPSSRRTAKWKMKISNFSYENIHNPATCLWENIIRSVKTRKEHLTMNKNIKVRSLSIWWMCCLSHYLMIIIILTNRIVKLLHQLVLDMEKYHHNLDQ